MSRVAVVFPPLRVSRDFIDYPYFADLGAVQAAASLLDLGHEVQLLDALGRHDAAIRWHDGSHFELGAPAEALVADLRTPEAIVLGYTPFHRPPARDALLGELLEALRARFPRVPIVLADLYQSGQHYVAAPPERVLAAFPEVDVWLRYEAEAVLGELLTELGRGQRGERRVLDGPEVPDLDALPLPAWSEIDVAAKLRLGDQLMSELGRPHWAFPVDGRSLPLVTSRGCPFRCAHCSSNPGLGAGAIKRQRRLSRASLAKRLDQLVSVGARRIHVLDELANVNEQHFDDLLDLIVERDLQLEIPNGLRADYVTERHVTALAARATTLSVSAESGSQRVVDEVVGKELRLEEIRRVASEASRAKLPLMVHFMIGLPGETRAETAQTLALAQELGEELGAWPSVQFATPLPGTRLARMVSEGRGSLPVVEDWGPRFQHEPSADTEAVTRQELKALRAAFDERLNVTRAPRTLVLDVTYRCNNHCDFCTTGTGLQVDVDPQVLEAALVEHHAAGARALRIEGGEPTLVTGLPELVARAKSVGYSSITLTTNGRLAAYREVAARLCAAGLSRLVVSLHGATPKTHGTLVRVPEAFEQTLSGIRNLVREAPPELQLAVSTTLTRSNLSELGALAGLVHELGIRELELRALSPFGPDTHMVAPDLDEAARAVSALLDAWHDRLTLRVRDVPPCKLPGRQAFIAPDEALLERALVHVGSHGVAPLAHARKQKEHREECGSCLWRPLCAGFFRTSGLVAPQWLVR